MSGLRRLIGALFRDGLGFVHLLATIPERSPVDARISVTNPSAIERFVADHAERNLYFGVAARLTHQSGRLGNCAALAALFSEIDFKDYGGDVDAARQRLATFSLPPSAVIASGGGLHCYWFLDLPLALQDGGAARAKRLLRALTRAVGGDLSAAEPARVLRLPGTKNFKYDPQRQVEIESFSDRRYSLTEIEALIPLADEPDDEAPSAPAAVDHDLDIPTRLRMARSYLAVEAPAVQGQGGDQRTFQICCAVAVGHDLPPDDAFEALKEWNARCTPPWSERDLRTKIRNANLYATGRRGEKLREFPNTEVGDAEFFASLGVEIVRYDHRRKRWLLINRATGIWLRDEVAMLIQLMKGVMRERQRRASDRSDKKAFNWALSGESRNRITNALALAQSVPPIADRGEDWDRDPWLLGCPNGVVDLRTGELRPALPDERVTMRTRIAFDADAECALFERTVRDIFVDDELVAYIQRALGYSLTADCREECFFLCWGSGSNGKGVLMKTVGWILGDYADDLPFSALELSDRSSIPNDIAKLVDKRFVTASETNAMLLNESRIKALTGRDPITARFLHQEFFTFEPVAKFWLAANEKPQVRDTSDGFWRRVHTIPFTQSFVDRADLTLKDRLREEGPGILAWMVRGALLWQRQGLQPPAAVVEATKEYRAETHQLGRFIKDRCVEQLGASVSIGDLLKNYQGWCFGQGEQPQFNRTTFDVEMKKRFSVSTRGNRLHYDGVGLLVREGDSHGPF